MYFLSGSAKTNKENEFLNPLRNNVLFAIIYFILCIVLYWNHFYLVKWYIPVAEILGTYIPIIFMFMYNGKKGPNIKYSFYAFYPVHLLILVGLHYLIV